MLASQPPPALTSNRLHKSSQSLFKYSYDNLETYVQKSGYATKQEIVNSFTNKQQRVTDVLLMKQTNRFISQNRQKQIINTSNQGFRFLVDRLAQCLVDDSYNLNNINHICKKLYKPKK